MTRNDLTNVPIVVGTDPTHGVPRTQRERSAVREAIVYVCEAMVGERGSKLLDLLARIEAEDGPAAAFDRMMKLLEFGQPKLQRVMVSDPGDGAPQAPIINVTFNGAAPTVTLEPVQPTAATPPAPPDLEADFTVVGGDA